MLKPVIARSVRVQRLPNKGRKLSLKRHSHRVRRFESPVPAPEQGWRVHLQSVFVEIRSVQEDFYDGQEHVRLEQKLMRSVQKLVRLAKKLVQNVKRLVRLAEKLVRSSKRLVRLVQKLVRSAQKGFEADNRPVRKALVNGYNRLNAGGKARTSGISAVLGEKPGITKMPMSSGKNFASRPLADERQSFNLLKTVVEEVNGRCGRFGRRADYDAGNVANKRRVLRPIVRQSGDVRDERGGQNSTVRCFA
jgi:hypothetical protein